MDITVNDLKYENSLGNIILKKIVVDMDEGQLNLYKKGFIIDELDYGLYGHDIEKAEMKIAKKFFKSHYIEILSGMYKLNCDEIKEIQTLLGLEAQRTRILR